MERTRHLRLSCGIILWGYFPVLISLPSSWFRNRSLGLAPKVGHAIAPDRQTHSHSATLSTRLRSARRKEVHTSDHVIRNDHFCGPPNLALISHSSEVVMGHPSSRLPAGRLSMTRTHDFGRMGEQRACSPMIPFCSQADHYSRILRSATT